MNSSEPRYFRAPQWFIRLLQVVFLIALSVFVVGLYYSEQVSVRGATSPSPERSCLARKGRGGGKDYYLSRSDYFLCQQLWLIAFLGMLTPGVTLWIYGRWAARDPKRLHTR